MFMRNRASLESRRAFLKGTAEKLSAALLVAEGARAGSAGILPAFDRRTSRAVLIEPIITSSNSKLALPIAHGKPANLTFATGPSFWEFSA